MILSKKASDIIRMMVLASILIFLGVFLTQTIGLFKGGIQENWNIFIFYIIFPAAALVGILGLFIALQKFNDSIVSYPTSVAFNTVDDEAHFLQKFNLFKSPFKLLFLSLIVFAIFGLYVSITKQSFIGVGTLPQQFTFTDNLMFTTFLVAVSENLGSAFWLALGLFGLYYYGRKNGWSKESIIVMSYFVSIFTFVDYGVLNHYSRYGSSDIAILNVAMFWGLGGLITYLTGSFIPFLIMHMSNNFFMELSKGFSSDIIMVWTIGIILALVIGYVIISYKMKGNKEGRVEVR